MKELTISSNPIFCLRKISRKNNLRRILLPEKNYGRWTIEENKLFEEKYIEYLQKKITLRDLKKSVPTRTKNQIHSHLFKKKYELDKKFCAIANKEIQEEIKSIKKFFEKEKSEKPAIETQLIFLRDEIRKKIFGISLENFILMKKFFPNKAEMKFDFQAIHNFLLAKKAKKEYDQMLQRHEKEKNRIENLFENYGFCTDNPLSPSIPVFDNSELSINCEPNNNFETEIISKKEKILDSDIKNESSMNLTTAENTPLIEKILYSFPNKLKDNSKNFISDFDKDNSNGRITKIFSNFVITNKKNLDFDKDEIYHNTDKNNNTIRSYYFSIQNKSNEFNKKKNLNDFSLKQSKDYHRKVTKNEVFINFKKQEKKKKDEKSSYGSISESEDNDCYFQNDFLKDFINETNSDINSDSIFSNLKSEKNINEEFSNHQFMGNKNNEFKYYLLTSKKFNQEDIFDFTKFEEEIGSKETSLLFNNLIWSLCEKNTNINHNSLQNFNLNLDENIFNKENSYYGNTTFYDYNGHSYFNNVVEKEFYDEDFGFNFDNPHSSL